MRASLTALILLGCTTPTTTPNTPISEAPAVDAGAAAVTPAPDAAPQAERWAATLVMPDTHFHNFVVTFVGQGGTLEVGDKTFPLVDVTVAPDRLVFALGTSELYDLVRTGDVANGTGTMRSGSLRIRMMKLAAGEAPHPAYARPQMPKPPFPYTERELVVDAPDGGKLAGTLSIPSGKGPFPAIALFSGSGQQDRDETVFGHKPFLVVADHLTRAGFAVYRFDDRGAGKTVGAASTLDVETADAGAIIDALKKQPEVDPKRLGALAHSATGQVVPFAALKHPVAFVVLLAGTTLSGRDYAAFQTEHALRLAGADEKTIAAMRKQQQQVSDATLKGVKAVEAVMKKLMAPELEAALGHKPTADELAQAIAVPLAQATNPWTMSYFRIDPRDAWKKLAIPVLLLVGDKDTQVPADMTIKALETSVKKGAAVTAKKLPGLNHFFQHAATGEIDEYLTIDETFDPATLEVLATWLTERKGPM